MMGCNGVGGRPGLRHDPIVRAMIRIKGRIVPGASYLWP